MSENTTLTPAQEAEILADARTMLAGGTKPNTPEEFAAFRRQLAVKAIANAACGTLYGHGAFDDLQWRLQFLQLGADALKGLGILMEASGSEGQIESRPRTEVAAIFRFFGEALYTPAIDAYSDMERLQRAAKGDLT